MNDQASACVEQIEKLGYKPGTKLNIFCSRCAERIEILSGKLDKAEIANFLNSHRGHGGCSFGFNDGRRWEIQNDGKMEVEEQSQRIEPTIEVVTPKEPLSKSNPGSNKGEDTISDPDVFKGDPFEDETWIKLYRKILKNPIFKDSVAYHLFSYLLLKANHKTNRFFFNKKETVVKRGQLITGIRQISKDTGISLWKIRDRLRLLNGLDMTTQKTTHRFSIITICNYNYYQDSKELLPHTKPHTEIVSKPHADHTLTTTNNNVRNKILFVEGSDELRLANLLLKEIRKNKPDFKQPNLQAWAKEVDLMMRIDKRSAEAIERVIRWGQSDHGDGTGRWKGWAAIILSTRNLREKFDKIEMRMQGEAIPKERGPKYIDGNVRGD